MLNFTQYSHWDPRFIQQNLNLCISKLYFNLHNYSSHVYYQGYLFLSTDVITSTSLIILNLITRCHHFLMYFKKLFIFYTQHAYINICIVVLIYFPHDRHFFNGSTHVDTLSNIFFLVFFLFFTIFWFTTIYNYIFGVFFPFQIFFWFTTCKTIFLMYFSYLKNFFGFTH